MDIVTHSQVVHRQVVHRQVVQLSGLNFFVKKSRNLFSFLCRKKKSFSFTFNKMALHFISFLFSVASMVLLIMTNIGTTFTSSSLNKVYLVELKDSATSRSIRYGVYNSCIYYNSSSTPQSCISSAPAYSFGKAMAVKKKKIINLYFLDATQFATLCGASSSKSSTYTELVSSSNVNSLFKSIAIILPTTLLAFVAFSCNIIDSAIIPFV